MDEDEEGKLLLNQDSKQELICCAEPSLAEAQPGERFQFFRHGYYIADEKLTAAGSGGAKVFNSIVGLKSSWKKG